MVIYVDEHPSIFLCSDIQPASTYRNGSQLFQKQSIASITPKTTEKRNSPQLWVCSKQKILSRLLLIKHFWQATPMYPERERRESEREWEENEGRRRGEEEEPQSVKHNLITPICHSYTWTHTAADLLVQMMQKQNNAEIFFQASTFFSNGRLEISFS